MHWIEELLHVSPDGGSGAVEFVVYLVLISFVAASVQGARVARRRRWLRRGRS